MKIRKARIEDVDLIIPVFKEYELASESYLPDKYKCIRNKRKPLKKHIKIALEKDITKKNSKFLVMEHNNMIVGYIFGEIRENKHPLFKEPKTGEVSDLAVLNEYQGKGIAGKLWRELENWFIKNKCEFISLSVNSNNTAQEIYKKWGFELFYLRMIKKL